MMKYLKGKSRIIIIFSILFLAVAVLLALIFLAGKKTYVVKFDLDGVASDDAAFVECAHNVALQAAAMNATYANKSDVPQSALDEEKEVLLNQMANDPAMAAKPEKVKEGIVMGKLGKFYETNCLAEQAYVKDDSMSVAKYIASVNKGIKIASFVKYEKGEGLQKREDDLAAEVAKLTRGE